MHQSGMKAHLFFSATPHVSRQWKPSCQFYTTADTLVSSFIFPHRLLDIYCFALLHLSTWPIHSQLHRSQLHTDLHCATYSIALTCLLPPQLPNQSPVGLKVLKAISQSPALLASFLSRLSLLFPSFSHPTPIQVSLLSTFRPLTSYNKSSAFTQPLSIFSDPLFAISP